MPEINRRSLLAASAVGGASALIGRVGPAEAAASIALQLFTQGDLNYSALTALGECAYGAGEPGEIIGTVNAINAAGASYQTFFQGFMARARSVAALAAAEYAAGFKASARSAYLRSAQYFSQALFFVLGTSTPQAETAVYAAMQAQWNAATKLFDWPTRRVWIPYEGTVLPGYLITPCVQNAPRRAPTVILVNGSDGQLIDLLAFGAAAAAERGWNALLLEGPGQGSMLFEHNIPMRPDWEKVITPVVDFLLRRPEVDPDRIAMTGWSIGGGLVIRAAAFENRLAAVCADPGFLSPWQAYPSAITGLFSSGASQRQVNKIWRTEIIPALNAQDRFTLSKRAELYGAQFRNAALAGQMFPDLWTLGQTVMAFDISSIAPRVTIPTLVTQYQQDQFFPGGGNQLYARLTCPKSLVTFTVADGAGYHDAPLAPQRRNQVIFDWLDKTLDVPRQQMPALD